MKAKKYYVAAVYEQEYILPSVVEQFESLKDAETYRELMSRVKDRNYVILEAK